MAGGDGVTTGRRGAALLVALMATGCAAHLPRADEPTVLLERTYVGASTAPGQSFEAAPVLHLVLANGLDDPDLFERGGSSAAFTASFLAVLRVSRGDSAPVRTPTYEPRAKLQLFHLVPLPRPPDAAARPPLVMGVLELSGGHRSNGQRGCSLADHVRRPGDGDFGCVPATDPPSQALDLEGGSFTTNYAAAGAYLRLLPPGAPAGPRPAAFTLGGTIEWQIACGLGACMPEPMRERYGPATVRWLAEGEVLVLRGVRRRLPFDGEVHLDTGLRVTLQGGAHLFAARSRADLSAEVALVPRHPRSFPVGVFVRRHQGYDYLNIRFEQRLDAWLFGVIFDPSPLDPGGGVQGPPRGRGLADRQ